MSQLPPPPPRGSPRAYWICQIAGWYGYAIAQTIASVVLVNLPPAIAAAEFFALHTGGLLISHGLHGYIRKHRWDALGRGAVTWRLFAAGLIVGTPIALVHQQLAVAAIRELSPVAPAWQAALQEIINWAAIFWAWMFIYLLVLGSRQRRYAELRQSELMRELQAAQLRALKAQLNPHFLFNSLNSVRALIAEDATSAQRAVTQLARTLRYSLGSADQPELVTLEQELAIVDDYLELEALRLGERLQIDRDLGADALRARIPVMLVQTLVENAIKHGIAELPRGGRLRITAQVRDGMLRLEIENPRPAKSERGEGVGLRNSTERLRLLFGDAASLDLDLSASDRAVARMRVPVGR